METQMTATLSGSAAFGASTSQRASSAYERMRSRASAVASDQGPISAKVRTRQVGVKLGGFGFTYTAKDLEMGPEIPVGVASASSGLPGRTAAASPSRWSQPDASPANRARGMSAYATQLRRHQEETVPSSILLSVV